MTQLVMEPCAHKLHTNFCQLTTNFPIVQPMCMHNVDDMNLSLSLFQLSEGAVKDYNRGRAYLSSIANKCRVQIFNNINDAVLSAVYILYFLY